MKRNAKYIFLSLLGLALASSAEAGNKVKVNIQSVPAENLQFSIHNDHKIGTLPYQAQEELRRIQQYASPEATVFYNPKFRSTRVDWCLEWSENCGQKAATIACKIYGYTKAINYIIDEDLGRTYVLADDVLCEDASCDGFDLIVCE